MPEFANIWNCDSVMAIRLFAWINPHFFNQAVQAFVVLGLADRTGGKKRVEQFLLTTEQLQLLFCRG